MQRFWLEDGSRYERPIRRLHGFWKRRNSWAISTETAR